MWFKYVLRCIPLINIYELLHPLGQLCKDTRIDKIWTSTNFWHRGPPPLASRATGRGTATRAPSAGSSWSARWTGVQGQNAEESLDLYSLLQSLEGYTVFPSLFASLKLKFTKMSRSMLLLSRRFRVQSWVCTKVPFLRPPKATGWFPASWRRRRCNWSANENNNLWNVLFAQVGGTTFCIPERFQLLQALGKGGAAGCLMAGHNWNRDSAKSGFACIATSCYSPSLIQWCWMYILNPNAY